MKEVEVMANQKTDIQQPDPDRDIIASFRTLHSNLASVGYLTNLPGFTPVNLPSKQRAEFGK